MNLRLFLVIDVVCGAGPFLGLGQQSLALDKDSNGRSNGQRVSACLDLWRGRINGGAGIMLCTYATIHTPRFGWALASTRL